ncbi:PP0621 family protein [Pusillimonas sp.]|uniref:PP0621 family protein n=1 Tax=Pusillimonas sp. TaxID=3040095 RepID=UPI0037CC486E
MGKLLLWAIVILAALIVARILARSSAVKHGDAPRAGSLPRKAPPPAMDEPESMVRCAHCGIHMPRSEALLVDGETWCSGEHAKLGQRR